MSSNDLNNTRFDSHSDSDVDQYTDYEDLFSQSDRKARRTRKPTAKHTPKKLQEQVLSEIADTNAIESGFQITYKPSKHEAGWLLSSLRSFFDQELIIDVLAKVKGGKEASVYRCQATPSTGKTLLAAKVYRPQMFRNLRNDQQYKEGRAILNKEGHVIKTNDHRIMRAIGKKSSFGEQVSHTSWLMYEYKTLDTLYRAGAAVPKPYATADNAILMEYVGDEHTAAHTLSELSLKRSEALPLFTEIMRNIDLMLQHNIIHGDLSAYNVLYWEGQITLIDFPQVIDISSNRSAYAILLRDVTRICDYFSRFGVKADAEAHTDEFWKRYAQTEPHMLAWDAEDGDEVE
ncbi:MAG: RIO1 family regulatory kinase/ATPase [Chloroflexota bacterium]